MHLSIKLKKSVKLWVLGIQEMHKQLYAKEFTYNTMKNKSLLP
jgi:hypothetical protein